MWFGRVYSFKPTSQVEDIAFGTTAEALPDATNELNRERRGVSLARVRRKRTEAGGAVAADLQFYLVVGQDIGHAELRAKLLEIDPGAHDCSFLNNPLEGGR